VECLDADTIRALATGAPDAPRAEAHLASCATCRARVDVERRASSADRGWVDTGTVPLGASPSPRPRGAASPAPELPRGTTVGRYTVLELVGRGGMGEVYAAYDPKLDRKIALKLLQADRARPAARAEARLLREAQAIAKVPHPNVVTVHDAGTFGDRVFVAMEFVDGETLKDWLARAPRSRAEILEVFAGAARGLEAAHAAGLVHRDFKPPNVMVGKDGGVRVTDFGLVRQLGDGAAAPTEAPAASALAAEEIPADLTRTGELHGTPRYMAPEQFKGEKLDARADQFSFCVALYEALYGQLPFAGDTLPALFTNVLDGRVAPPPAKTTVPGWLRRIVLRGLEVDPERRFPSMRALLVALEADPTARRRRIGLAAGVIVCLALAAVGARRLGGPSATTLCRGGAERFAAAWAPAGDGNGARIHAAFRATGRSYAEQAFASVSRLLDEYGRSWVSMYAEACEATHLRGEQSAEVLDLRMACLRERLGSARALTELYERADGTTVENAVAAASALPPVDRCADVALLKAVVKPPESESVRARVEASRGDVARLAALREAGHCREAETLAEALIPRARQTGYLPLVGQSLLEGGLLSNECISAAVADQRFEEAFATALAARDDETASQAAIILAATTGDREGRVADGRRWLTIGRSLLARSENHPRLDAWLLVSEGIIFQKENRGAEAADALARATAIKEKILGRDNLDTLSSIIDWGNGLVIAGRPAEALEKFTDSRERLQRVVGPDHPRLGFALNNEGEALNALGRPREAARACARAVDIFRAGGINAQVVAYPQTCLGIGLVDDGRPGDAVAPLEEALRVRVEGQLDPGLVAETRFALARALWSRPDDRARALASARAARDEYARTARSASKVAAVDAWLAAPPRAGAHASLPPERRRP
jgi:predicted Ser/Thr protein kinase